MTEYPQQVILKAFTDNKINIKQGQPAKKQALKIIETLKEVMPLERMKIRMRFSVGQDQMELAKTMIAETVDNKDYEIEQETLKELVIVYEPLWFREFDNILQELKRADQACSIEILDNSVIKLFSTKKDELKQQQMMEDMKKMKIE